MEKNLKPIYEFTIKRSTLEYTTANAAFYSFRGESNIYKLIDSLMIGNSMDIFKKAIEDEKYNEMFLLTVSDKNGNPVNTAVKLVKREKSELVGVKMIEAERLFEGYCSARLREKEADALLSQYDNVFFDYDKKTNIMTCYKYDMGREVLGQRPIEEWADVVKKKTSENSAEKIDKFASELKNGARSTECVVYAKNNREFNLEGTAVYLDDAHVKTVGRISAEGEGGSRESSLRDPLTGLFLKDVIANYAKRRIDEQKLRTTLAIIDIDNFKSVNDNFGHSKGDEVLKKCAAIIAEETESFGKAGRIGGDEFFAVFDAEVDIDQVKNVLRAVKNRIADAYSEEINGFKVTSSIGVAIYPDDTDGDYASMFKLADCLLYRAKSKGKNRWIIYNREKHGSIEDILEHGVKKAGLSGGRGIDKSELVCKITSISICGGQYPLDNILDDIINCFGVERIIIYDKAERKIQTQFGNRILTKEIVAETVDFIYDEHFTSEFSDKLFVMNNVRYFSAKAPHIFDMLMKQGVCSSMFFDLTGKSGKEFLISYEKINGVETWNTSDMHYYRILNKIISDQL